MVRKHFIRLAIVLLSAVILIAAGRTFILYKLKQKIEERFKQAEDSGFQVSYDSLQTSWTGNLKICQLRISRDSLKTIDLSIDKLKVEGISLWSLIVLKELSIDKIVMSRPLIVYSAHPTSKSNTASAMKKILIGELHIDSLGVVVKDSASQNRVFHGHCNVSAKNIAFELGKSWSVGEVDISAVNGWLPKTFYKMTIQHLTYQQVKKEFRVDSVLVLPLYDKNEFMRRTGHQTDRITGGISRIIISEFEPGSSGIAIKGRRAHVQFALDAYRDKRIPRKHRKPTVLPMQFIDALSFPLTIDTISIDSSRVSYEHFPEKGEGTGKIYFDQLQAAIYNLSNRSEEDAVMEAHSRFQKGGELACRVTFPHSLKREGTVNGMLNNFKMEELNTMLVPVAHVEVKSGIMQQLKFNFQYDLYHSSGEVKLSYTDLKLEGLKKNGGHGKDNLLSLVINMFVKENMSQSIPKEKRTGKIDWQRDPQRGILNYWWKSIFSGIASVFGFEKVVASEANSQK